MVDQIAMSQTPITVVVVEDSTWVRNAITAHLSKEDGIEVLGTASEVNDAVALVATVQPQVVLLDMRLVGGTGLDVCRRIRSSGLKTKFLVLTAYWELQYVRSFTALGVNGYMSKQIRLLELPDAIRKVANGWTLVSPEVASLFEGITWPQWAMAGGQPYSQLTPREAQILELKNAGLRNSEIARRLAISAKTVGDHVQRILLKGSGKHGEAPVPAVSREAVQQRESNGI